MLYIKIVFNTLLDIIFFQDILSSLFFIVSFIFIFLLYKNILKRKNKFLIIIRILILLLILPIINNKVYKTEEFSLNHQNIGVFIDNSLSVNKILSNNLSLDFHSKIALIEKWGQDSDVKLTWYNLNSNLSNLDQILFDNNETSYDYISQILTNNILDQLIIISDGNVNAGLLAGDFHNNQGIKIHSVGLGSIVDYKQDVGIENLSIKQSDDSLYIKTKFLINIDNKKTDSLIYNIYSKSNKIYSDTLSFVNGRYRLDKNTNLNLNVIDKDLSVEIVPLTYLDSKNHNNNWSLNIPNQSKTKILLITGKLNYNTSFLKEIILSISNASLVHKVVYNEKFDYSTIDINSFDCIVLDNFPNNIHELSLFSQLYNLKKNIVFFEGNNFNPSFLKNMLDIAFPDQFYIDNNNGVKSFKLNNEFDFGTIKSNYNLFSKDSFFQKKYLFSNQSIAHIVHADLSIVLIPSISEISFFMENKYNNNYIANYIKYFINQNLINNHLVSLKLKKNNYLIGEKLLFDLDDNIPIDISSKQVIINNFENMSIDTLDYYPGMQLFLNKKGAFEIYFTFKGTNLEIINSNKEMFYVDENNIELEKITQNVDLLMNLSQQTNGIYLDVNDFNQSFLDSLKSLPIKKKYQNIYTPLDVFIKENIFILVIMLFCIEILLRKKVGLL